MFLILLALVAFVALSLSSAEHDQYTVSHAAIAQLSKNNDALRSQVETLGQKPVAPPAAAVVQSVGQPGTNGKDGKDGKDGRGVVTFTCQANGQWLILYTDASTGTAQGPCIGATGAPGANGANGANGAPGVNGTNGTNGANGADGQPPTSWTYPLTYTDIKGQHTEDYTCTRTSPFDPNNPTYSCEASK